MHEDEFKNIVKTYKVCQWENSPSDRLLDALADAVLLLTAEVKELKAEVAKFKIELLVRDEG